MLRPIFGFRILIMKKTGSQIIAESLKKEGVDIIFNYPGGAVIPLFDELQNVPFRQILVRHEQAAVHAADGYARATGKVGVVIVTSGRGQPIPLLALPQPLWTLSRSLS